MSTFRTFLLLVVFILASSSHAQHDGSQSSAKELMIVQFSRVEKRIWIFDAEGDVSATRTAGQAMRTGRSAEEHTQELLKVLQKLYNEGCTMVTSSTESLSTGSTIYLLERN